MSAILVVDDERSIRESLSMILSDTGYAIDTAASGLEALDCLHRHHYDLVLTDIRMPGMDGMELLKQIHSNWQDSTSVILISAFATEQTVAEALHFGARDLIVKPFDIETVRNAVTYVLEQKAKSPVELAEQPLAEQTPKERIGQREREQDVNRKLLEYSVLDQIGKTVNATVGIERIGSTIISMVQQICKADYALIVVYQQDRHGYQYRCALLDGQPTLAEPTPADEFILEWLIKQRRSLYVRQLSQDKEFVDCYTSGSLLAVPFMRKTQMIGALILYSKDENNPFDGGTMQFLSVLASMATAAIENAALYHELKNYFNGTVKALLTTMDAKDSFIFNHCSRVARYSLMIGKQLELSDVELRRLEYLAMLHDIGKIGIPEDILRQKAKLSDWEKSIFKTHCEVGENIVKSITFLPGGNQVIRHHHEQFDGLGYPDKLKGDAIPLFSRIIAVANHFDMLTSDYPGMQPMEPAEAMERMIRDAGKIFDPELLNIFLNAYRKQMLKT